jgi:hypothetical protein
MYCSVMANIVAMPAAEFRTGDYIKSEGRDAEVRAGQSVSLLNMRSGVECLRLQAKPIEAAWMEVADLTSVDD